MRQEQEEGQQESVALQPPPEAGQEPGSTGSGGGAEGQLARAELRTIKDHRPIGTIEFRQNGEALDVSADLNGLPQGPLTLEVSRAASCPRQLEGTSRTDLAASRAQPAASSLSAEQRAAGETSGGSAVSGPGPEEGASARDLGELVATVGGNVDHRWSISGLSLGGEAGLLGEGITVRPRQSGSEPGQPVEGVEAVACGIIESVEG